MKKTAQFSTNPHDLAILMITEMERKKLVSEIEELCREGKRWHSCTVSAHVPLFKKIHKFLTHPTSESGRVEEQLIRAYMAAAEQCMEERPSDEMGTRAEWRNFRKVEARFDAAKEALDAHLASHSQPSAENDVG